MDGAPFYGHAGKKQKDTACTQLCASHASSHLCGILYRMSMLRGSAAEFAVHGIRLLLM